MSVLCLSCGTATEQGLLLRWRAVGKQRGEISRVWPFCEAHLPVFRNMAGHYLGESRDLVNPCYQHVREFVAWLEWAVQPIVTFEGFIYLFRADTAYKIGFTNQVEKRRRYLQVNNPVPVTLVGSWLANRAHEETLHKALRCWQTRGEWYRFPPGVDPVAHLAFQINRLRSATCG